MKTGLSIFEPKPLVKPGGSVLPFLVQKAARPKLTRFTSSLRIPVVPANRNLLRHLRAAELAAWRSARVRAMARV